MADNRYRNNQHINRHRPLSLTLSNPNHPLNHGWEFSHHNEEFDQAVYEQEGMKLMFLDNLWWIQILNEYAMPREGSIKEITEDALKELSR